MARSLTVKHEESPSALFATFLILCGAFLLLGAALGTAGEPDPGQTPPASASTIPTPGH